MARRTGQSCFRVGLTERPVRRKHSAMESWHACNNSDDVFRAAWLPCAPSLALQALMACTRFASRVHIRWVTMLCPEPLADRRVFVFQDAVDQAAVGANEVAADQLNALVEIAPLANHVPQQVAGSLMSCDLGTLQRLCPHGDLRGIEKVPDGERFDEQLRNAYAHRADDVFRVGLVGQ